MPALAPNLRQLARTLLGTVPVPVWKLLAPKDLIALSYHVVSDRELPYQLLYSYKTPAQFEEDVRYASDDAVSYEQVSELRRRSLRLPPHRFLFTFDDGFSQCFEVVRPILSAHAVRGVYFINIDFLDDKRPFFEATMSSILHTVAGLPVDRAAELLARLRAHAVADPTASTDGNGRAHERFRSARIRMPPTDPHVALAYWILGFEEDQEEALLGVADLLGVPTRGATAPGAFMTTSQVRALAAEGSTIGSHGFSHLALQKLGREELKRAIVESCAAVRDLTGQRRVPFAFPYSATGIDRGILAEVRAREPFVDLFFDTEAFHRDCDFVVQRVAADLPPSRGRMGTNLPEILRRTWSRRSAWYRDGHVGRPARDVARPGVAAAAVPHADGGSEEAHSMKLLIVILNYNVTELTIDCLRSLAPIIGEVAGARVAVLENGSNDPGAFALLQDAVAREGWGGWVELSSTRPNRGFTGGNNLVIRKALASSNPPEYFLLLNADTLVRKNALRSLVEFMDAHPAAGIGGSRMLHPDGSTGPSPYRFHNPANQFDTALRLGVVSRLLRRWRTVLPPVDQPSCVDWVSGASMILRADMLRQIGLLDEALYTYFDDIDLCLRARRAGWESWCIPDSRVVHLEGASTGVGARIVKRRPAYWFQARRRFFLKNYGALRTAILDAVFLAGLSISRLRRLWGDRDPDPPFFLRDSFRHSVFAAGFKVTVVENPAMRRSGEASPGPALAPPPPSSPG